MICASGLCVELFLTHLRWLFLDSIWHHRLWRPGLIQFILTHIELQIEMTIESFKSMGTANVSAQYYLFLDVSSKLHVLFFLFFSFFILKKTKIKSQLTITIFMLIINLDQDPNKSKHCVLKNVSEMGRWDIFLYMYKIVSK